MKGITRVVLSGAVLITSPIISVAHASQIDDCYATCRSDKDTASMHCFNNYYGQGDIQEQCLYQVEQEYEACEDNCRVEYPSAYVSPSDAARYKPIELRTDRLPA